MADKLQMFHLPAKIVDFMTILIQKVGYIYF